VLVGLCAALSSAACSASSPSAESTGCTGEATTSIDVTVVDDSNEPTDLCNATVTATGAAGSAVTLSLVGGAGNCSYIGDVKGSGKYSLTVTVPDYPTTLSSVDVESGCSISTSVDVMMQ
jgi:hypothetical protein